MLALLLVGVTFLALGAVPAIAQGVFDHLKCHSVKDPVQLNHDVDLDALQHEFSDTDCELTGRAKYFCVPVSKDNVRPAPPLPDVVGQTLQSDYTCYTLKCKNKPPDRDVTDQFGGPRLQSKYKTELLCVPSFKKDLPCGLTGIHNGRPQCGGACPNPGEFCASPDDGACRCIFQGHGGG